MIEEMTQDLKGLRFAFPVRCTIDTPNPEDALDDTVLHATFRMGERILAGLEVIKQDAIQPIDVEKGVTLKVVFYGTCETVIISEARIAHHVVGLVLEVAGFFEVAVHGRVFES